MNLSGIVNAMHTCKDLCSHCPLHVLHVLQHLLYSQMNKLILILLEEFKIICNKISLLSMPIFFRPSCNLYPVIQWTLACEKQSIKEYILCW